MSASVNIEFTPEAKAVLKRFETLPQRLLVAIARGMDLANQESIGVIQRDFMSFPKNQPTTMAGLRVISNRLRGSVRASKAVISGQEVTSTIGSNVKYAAIHEFGGTIKRVLLAGSVQLRTDARGNLLRQGKNGKLAVFAKPGHKRTANVPYAGGKRYEITIPARAPFMRGIQKNLSRTMKLISDAILKEATA